MLLTLGSCIYSFLYLCVSVEKPTTELKQLVFFFIKTYVYVWFKIKRNHSIINVTMHVYKTITISRYLPKNCKRRYILFLNLTSSLIIPNLLVSKITDEREHIRKLRFRQTLIAMPSVTARARTIRDFVISSTILALLYV